MKKIFALLFIITSISGFAQSPVYPEKTNKYINDFANVIPDEQEENLANICKNIETESSSQIVVVTTNDIDKEYPIEDYSIQLARNWGIGQKGVNNGLLILICPNNRKSRLEVGYGLEGILTDALTRRMQENYFKPNFRKGDFYTGIQQILLSIKSQINPEAIQQREAFAKQKEKESREVWAKFWDGVLYVLFFGIVILLLIFVIKKQIEKQKAIKEEEERKRLEIERKKREEELAEQRLISRAKSLESQIVSKFEKTKSALRDMGDFLNANQILKVLEDMYLMVQNNIKNAKYTEYDSIVQDGNSKIETLCSDILNKFEIKKRVYSFVNIDFPNFRKFEFDFEKTISITKSNYSLYDKAIWAKNFNISDCSIDKFFNVLSIVENLQKESQEDIQNLNFDSAIGKIKKAEDQILVLKAFKDSLDSTNNKIKISNDFIKKSSTTFNKILLSIDDVYSHQYVKTNTLHDWKHKRGTILFKIPDNYINPFEEQTRIESFFKSLEEYKKPALLDIKKETERLEAIRAEEERQRKERERKEEERRRRKREEEEEERRRNSYSSSSYDFGSSSYDSGSSSYGSSSSDSSSSSFGGGDFGGGGSSSDW